LIVESDPELGRVWAQHIERLGVRARYASSQFAAVEALNADAFEVIVLDLTLAGGDALDVADFARYCQPEAKVIFVTGTSLFPDGSIFNVSPNASAYLHSDLPPEDLAAIMEYHAAAG
jgi:DNA-binding NtrC family response regulator